MLTNKQTNTTTSNKKRKEEAWQPMQKKQRNRKNPSQGADHDQYCVFNTQVHEEQRMTEDQSMNVCVFACLSFFRD